MRSADTFAGVSGPAAGPAAARADQRRPADDLVRIYVERVTRALTGVARQLSRRRLVEVAAAATDADVLTYSLQDAAAAEPAAARSDPLTAALLRGAETKREILRAEGGVLPAGQLAEHLHISTQALNKRREKQQVCWVPSGDGYLYPVFQFGADGLLAGMREVLDALTAAGVLDPWMRVNFLLTGDGRLEGRRPLDLLRAGRIDPVVRAARAYGQHGAA